MLKGLRATHRGAVSRPSWPATSRRDSSAVEVGLVKAAARSAAVGSGARGEGESSPTGRPPSIEPRGERRQHLGHVPNQVLLVLGGLHHHQPPPGTQQGRLDLLGAQPGKAVRVLNDDALHRRISEQPAQLAAEIAGLVVRGDPCVQRNATGAARLPSLVSAGQGTNSPMAAIATVEFRVWCRQQDSNLRPWA